MFNGIEMFYIFDLIDRLLLSSKEYPLYESFSSILVIENLCVVEFRPHIVQN